MPFQSLTALCCAMLSLVLQGSNSQPPEHGGVVTGSVRYGDTGTPADGVRVWLTPAREPIGVQPDPITGNYDVRDASGVRITPTSVAPDGTFTLKNVPAGVYVVHTYSPAYVSPDDTMYPTSNSVHIAVGPSPSPKALSVEVTSEQKTKPVDIVLQRGGTIEGSVSLPRGDGGASGLRLEGLAVNAERKLGPNTYARVGGAAHTDARGRYQLSGLSPGEYIVFVGMGRGLPIYSPDTVRPSRASVVKLQGAEAQHLDIALPPAASLHKIEGNVRFEGSEPVQDALLRLYPSGEGGLTAAQPLTAARSFAFENVPDGDYTIALQFSPISKIVSIDVAKGVIHMQRRPSTYIDATHEVHVAGHDLTSVSLTAARRSPQ